MSDNSDTTNNSAGDNTNSTADEGSTSSLFSNLTNKLKYNLHKAVYDPNANKFIEEQAKKKKASTTTTDTNASTPSDPNKFNTVRLAKKVGNQTLDILKKIFFPFIALMLAMIVTNELIIYAVPIRIIFFIVTLAICIYSQTAAISLSLYYIFKGSYSYYVNNMTDRPKKNIMPTIFALLPITTYKPMSSFSSFFMYPFTYPKTEKAALKLPEVMKGYWESLVESFKDFDKIKNLPLFVEDIKNIQYDLSHLHDLSGSAINLKANQSNKMVAPQPSAPPAENGVNKSNSSAQPANNMVNKSNSSSAPPVPSAPPAENGVNKSNSKPSAPPVPSAPPANNNNNPN